MKLFKTIPFHDWALDARFNDDNLRFSAAEIRHGLTGVNLGANLFKKRVGLCGRGKRSSARLIICYRHELLIYLLGFAKNEKENITTKELLALRKISKYYASLNDLQITRLIERQELIEVKE